MSPDAKPSPGRGRRSQDARGWRESKGKPTAPAGAEDECDRYDLEAPEAAGYSSDPLTADEWSAIWRAESRDLAEVVE